MGGAKARYSVKRLEKLVVLLRQSSSKWLFAKGNPAILFGELKDGRGTRSLVGKMGRIPCFALIVGLANLFCFMVTS